MQLETRELGVKYGQRYVLKQITLVLPSAKVVVLVGPNGSGKTTLLRTLAGLVRPARGGYFRQPLVKNPSGEHVAYVPQSPQIHPFSVRETVAMGRYRRTPRFAKLNHASVLAVDEALERCGLASLAKRKFNTLSGGERQRVILARALCHDAPLLLLDEPTAGMDIRHQILTMHELRKEARIGKTVVLALHDIGLASRFADHLVALNHGVVVAEGAPGDVVTPQLLKTVFGVTVRQDSQSMYAFDVL